MIKLLSPKLQWRDCRHAALPRRITHLVLNRAEAPYRFMHEAALIHYRGRFFTAWNACGVSESDRDTVIHWTSWDENFTQNSGVRAIRPALRIDETTNWESCQLFEFQGALHALVGQLHCQPHTEGDNGGRTILFRLTAGDVWEEVAVQEGFHPLNSPVTLPDGRLLCGGQYNLHQPRVMLQEAPGDLTRWKVIALPHDDTARAHFAETALLRVKNGVRAFVRSCGGFCLTAFSADGENWTKLEPADIPVSDSKMAAGRLSSGEGYLILNSPVEGGGSRDWLQILVTEPGEDEFIRQVTIRNAVSPFCRDGRRASQWSYPSAVEFAGSFYVAYSISKEDVGLSILPLTELL